MKKIIKFLYFIKLYIYEIIMKHKNIRVKL